MAINGQTDLQAMLTDPRRGALSKYIGFAVGSSSLTRFLAQEIILSIAGPAPGALGYVLRRMLYPYLFAAVGRHVTIGRNVVIRHPHRIRIGSNVIIDDNCVLDARGTRGRGICIGDSVMLGRNTVLALKDGTIELGDNTNIGMTCALQTTRSIRIGRNCIIAAYTNLVAGGNHRFDDVTRPIIAQGMVPAKGITLEENVWLGARVTVLDGITIGEGSVIGACALVTRDIPAMSVATGIPARVARKRE